MYTLEQILSYQLPIFHKRKFRVSDILVILVITYAAILARFSLFDFASRDYSIFLSQWFDSLKLAGGFKGLALNLGDYTPPYIYILAALTYLPINSLYSIKIVSCIFDFACAILIFKMIYDHTEKVFLSTLGYGIFLFAPTVLLNSAYWAQCDIIYTFFLLLCVDRFLQDRPTGAMIYFAIAFTFKLQSIFLAPFLLLLWIKGKCKLHHFLLIPAIYILSITPAFIMGRPFMELLTIYQSQSKQYSQLSLNATNFYLWFGSENQNYLLSKAGILLCGVIILLILYYSLHHIKQWNPQLIVSFALLFSILVPFFLPHMHERYFYVADVFSIIYAFYYPKHFYIPIGVSLCSLASYCPYLFLITPIPLAYMAIVMLIMLIFVGINIYHQIQQQSTDA